MGPWGGERCAAGGAGPQASAAGSRGRVRAARGCSARPRGRGGRRVPCGAPGAHVGPLGGRGPTLRPRGRGTRAVGPGLGPDTGPGPESPRTGNVDRKPGRRRGDCPGRSAPPRPRPASAPALRFSRASTGGGAEVCERSLEVSRCGWAGRAHTTRLHPSSAVGPRTPEFWTNGPGTVASACLWPPLRFSRTSSWKLRRADLPRGRAGTQPPGPPSSAKD